MIGSGDISSGHSLGGKRRLPLSCGGMRRCALVDRSGVHLLLIDRVHRLALVLGLLASASRGLAAQATAEPEHWRIAFTPYVWMSGLEGTIGVGSNTSEVDGGLQRGRRGLRVRLRGSAGDPASPLGPSNRLLLRLALGR